VRHNDHTAASHVPFSCGVPTDSRMELRPATINGISPADPKGIFTDVESDLSRSRKVKPSNRHACQNVKREAHIGHVYRARIRKSFTLRYYLWQPQSDR